MQADSLNKEYQIMKWKKKEYSYINSNMIYRTIKFVVLVPKTPPVTLVPKVFFGNAIG